VQREKRAAEKDESSGAFGKQPGSERGETETTEYERVMDHGNQ